MSFQNLDRARARLLELFEIDVASFVTANAWKTAVTSFQKRHLLAHKMGVIDREYVSKAGDVTAVSGRKVVISAKEVRELANIPGGHPKSPICGHLKIPHP